MLMGRAKAYSISYLQAVTHRSTNRARRRVTSFSAETRYQLRHAINASTMAPPCEWYRLSQPESAEKCIKPPISAFKVIQGHWIRRQSKASIRFPISD